MKKLWFPDWIEKEDKFREHEYQLGIYGQLLETTPKHEKHYKEIIRRIKSDLRNLKKIKLPSEVEKEKE